MENTISQKHNKMEIKKAVMLTDFQKNEENPFMKQAIEGIENHVVKKYKSNSGVVANAASSNPIPKRSIKILGAVVFVPTSIPT